MRYAMPGRRDWPPPVMRLIAPCGPPMAGPTSTRTRRATKDATAWNYRDAQWGMTVIGVSPDPADNDTMIAWAREYWNALHPYAAGGAYINMMMEEGQDRVRASYGDHYDRLARIKATYDPDNLFRVNQNIKPA
jgi:FAD/FMN-containing dehydrogenase